METTAVKLYSLDYRDAKTYLAAALFVAGNIVLPQICHAVPQGGLRWLPIYFFTLVGAYKYGWRVGLLTAVLSPLVNSALFGMPAAAALPAILLSPYCWPQPPDSPHGGSGALRCRCWRAWCSSTRRRVRWANGPSRVRRPPPCRISASGFPACSRRRRAVT